LDNVLIFHAPSDYILTLPGRAPINLSLLIKNANLSQLTLNEALIEKLGEKLRSIMSPHREDKINNHIVNLLPEVEQRVVRLYIGLL